MRSLPEHRLPQSALKVWRIGGGLRSLFFWLIPAIMLMLRLDDGGGPPIWSIYFTGMLVLVVTLLWIWLVPVIRWKRWKYHVDEDEIDLLHGVFIVRRTLIPINRVQHVDTRQGPILRKFGLANVAISTAATTHEVPALDEETADRLRDQISNFARLAKEDV